MAAGTRAQSIAGEPQPFRRANTVLLYTNASPVAVLRELGENLRQRGFALDSVDYEGGVVTTMPTIPPGTESWPLVIRLATMSGGVRLTGSVAALGVGSNVFYPSEFWGFDWSPAKKRFAR